MRERASGSGRVRDCVCESRCATECVEGDGRRGQGGGGGASSASLKCTNLYVFQSYGSVKACHPNLDLWYR